MRRVSRLMTWPFAAPAGGAWIAELDGGRGETPPLDRWGRDGEAFPGAAALDDVKRGLPPGEAAARLSVVRLARAAADGRVPPALLERERAAVRGYIQAGGCPHEEAAALEAAAALALVGPAPALARALRQAAAAALTGGCTGGAESLWRAAYAIAAPRGWHAEVIVAADALAECARWNGARAAAALWTQRVRRHRRRLELDAAGEDGLPRAEGPAEVGTPQKE